jgi:hypothetical protein
MDDRQKLAVFIDVANAENLDFPQLLERVRQLGQIEEVRAYGDYRQYHLDGLALELYALGIVMIHCPSWANGNQDSNGISKRKRSDDGLLYQGVRDFLEKRPDISIYILVTADSDIIPTVHRIREHGKQELLIYDKSDGSLGRILALCHFRMEAGPSREERIVLVTT